MGGFFNPLRAMDAYNVLAKVLIFVCVELLQTLLPHQVCATLMCTALLPFSIMNNAPESVKKDKLTIIDWLIEHFPAAFFKKAKHIKPLKIGIFDDIIDFYERLDSPPFSKKSLREALNYYSSSPAYLTSQKANAARIDLFGNDIDVVTEEQANYAQQRFLQRYQERNSTERLKSPAKNGA